MDGDKNVDMVNHPPHYGNGPDDPYEHIKIMEATLSRDEFHGAMRYQVTKYLHRLAKKGDPIENARKAQWYMNRLVTYMERSGRSAPWFRDVGLSTLAQQLADSVLPPNTDCTVPPPSHPGERMGLMGVGYVGRMRGDGLLVWALSDEERADKRNYAAPLHIGDTMKIGDIEYVGRWSENGSGLQWAEKSDRRVPR